MLKPPGVLLSLLFAAAGVAGASGAAIEKAAIEKIETKHLTASASVAAVTAGGRVTLALDVAPKRAMHVYAPPQTDYIPVSLAIQPDPAIKAGAPQFPRPQTLRIEALDETQSVYSARFRIAQEVTLAPAALRQARAAGGLTVKGTLRYQACDDTICYLPVNVPVAWTVALTPGGRLVP